MMLSKQKKISIIIPCRNEELNLVDCLDSVLAQTYKNIDIVIVDDMSTDKTSEIIDSYKNIYPFISKISIKNKPENWVGKSYAIYQGTLLCRGELLLFLDADVKLKKNCLEKALIYLDEYGLDFLSFAAYQECKSLFEYSVQPLMFYILNILFPFDKKTKLNTSGKVCNGIFLLCKNECYLAIGTHKVIKDEVLEDVALAKKIKKSGGHLGFIYEPEIISVRMYRNLKDIVAGWSKNFFALLDYSILRSFLIIFVLLLVFYIPILAILVDINFLMVNILWITIFILQYCYSCFKMKYKWWVGLFFPIGGLLVIFIIINSVINFKFKGTVKWKNRDIKVIQ